MYLNNLMLIFWFLFVVNLGFVSSQSCGNSLSFKPNGTYDRNRRLVLSTLASRVSSRDGFYNGSVGDGPERIYALGLCIPGTDPEVCSDCIRQASNSLLQNCLTQTDSFYWRSDQTLCFVRYSSHSFFSQSDLEPTQTEEITLDITGDVKEYYKIWDKLMSGMISAASSSTPGSPARRHYAADVSLLSDSQNIYALMQCIPGISLINCNQCLQENILTYKNCCRKRQGVTVKKPVCFFRFDSNPYFNAFTNITSTPPPDSKKISTGVITAIVVFAVLTMALFGLGFVLLKKRLSYKTLEILTEDHDMTSLQLLQFDFKTIEVATDGFAENNKVGHGGFGEVYKGTLPDETEVAVKRLSKNSGQGSQEFKNEVVLVAKLQHRNLVRLLGFCLEGDEHILVYEFVPNKSLDYFLFDQTKKNQLDWSSRFNIIEGITRGILYLHQDSRLTIIHRDIKASNILLDADMNPKIADFGMARNFRDHQTEENTGRVVGTFGYMSPEYMLYGFFSTKSDIYSFGILILEIVTGKKNSSFYHMDSSVCNLVTYVSRLWNNGSPLDLIDPAIRESHEMDEVIRCIHIGLLCVQETPEDRPAMSTVFQMLTNGSITLPVPRQPGFFLRSRSESSDQIAPELRPGSSNSMSIPPIDYDSITSVTST